MDTIAGSPLQRVDFPPQNKVHPRMDSGLPAQTKSSRVYSELKRDITAGTYRPGEHLVRRDLVKKYGVSLSIVNEALGRLSCDGLVETKEMVGTRVVSLTDQSLRDEFALREAIERHVIRVLVERASDEALTALLDDARTIDRWMNELGHDETQGSLLHLEFHLKMARLSGYVSLEEALKRMSMRALLTTRWLKNQRLPHPEDFHQQLVRAILKRDPIAADEMMRAHLHYADDYMATHGIKASESKERPVSSGSLNPRGSAG